MTRLLFKILNVTSTKSEQKRKSYHHILLIFKYALNLVKLVHLTRLHPVDLILCIRFFKLRFFKLKSTGLYPCSKVALNLH